VCVCVCVCVCVFAVATRLLIERDETCWLGGKYSRRARAF
jgi:hypothetical protein